MKRSMAIVAMGLAMSLGACSSSNSDRSTARDVGRMGSSSAGESTPDKRLEMSDLSEQDRQFIKTASSGGQYEVEAGKLALQKSQDDHVRMIAQHMVQDHTQANAQLMQIAQQKGATPNSAPSTDQDKMLTELRGLNGPEFDRQYISQQTQAHQETIALFQQEANNGSDNQVKQFAAQTLPTLQEHLRMISSQNNGSNPRR